MRLVYRRAIGVVCLAGIAAGCSNLTSRPVSFESFDSTTRYSRNVAATDEQACEAARRALLSQAYVVSVQRADHLSGRKSFQVDNETHIQIEVQVVCARNRDADARAVVFVSALQDRYELKKGNSSASVGVGAVGSLSLPFAGGSESLVKVGSQTISADVFYDRFFVVLGRYLSIADETRSSK